MSNIVFENPQNFFHCNTAQREEYFATEHKEETRVHFNNEDHHFGELMRLALAGNSNVVASGFREPQPFENYLTMYVQTVRDQRTEAIPIVQKAVKTAKGQLIKDAKLFEHLVLRMMRNRDHKF